jgi:2,3-bisphosphoglycerate-dependent phosphoglycerate mutase
MAQKKKKNALTLYVLAHTESCYNRRHIFTGWKDSKLSPLGHKNATMLGQKLKNADFGLAFVSPLSRSRQTLRHILAYHPKATVITDRRIMERDYGKLAGKSKDKYKRDFPEKFEIYHRSYDVPPPGGESIKDVENRVLPFLKDAFRVMREKNTNAILVAHSNTLRPIRRYFEKLTPKEMMALEGMYNNIYTYKITR